MEYSKVDTNHRTSKHRPALITNVKQSIQLALDESGWSSNAHTKKSNVTISENNKLEGDSGMQWTVDLAVLDFKGEPTAVIFCLDSSKIENALIKAAATCQDLYSTDAMMVLVVKGNKSGPLVLPGYDQLFASNHVQVIEWKPERALELVIDILQRLRRRYPKMHGKSVAEAAKSLTVKYPDLFIDNRQIPKKTSCLELLQQIKEYDPHLHYGEIIKDVLSQDGTCQSLVGNRLTSISDAKLEKLLKEHLKQQNGH